MMASKEEHPKLILLGFLMKLNGWRYWEDFQAYLYNITIPFRKLARCIASNIKRKKS